MRVPVWINDVLVSLEGGAVGGAGGVAVLIIVGGSSLEEAVVGICIKGCASGGLDGVGLCADGSKCSNWADSSLEEGPFDLWGISTSRVSDGAECAEFVLEVKDEGKGAAFPGGVVTKADQGDVLDELLPIQGCLGGLLGVCTEGLEDLLCIGVVADEFLACINLECIHKDRVHEFIL